MREEGKKSMQNLGSPNIMVWYGVSIGIRDSWYYIQMNYSHAVGSALTSAVVSVFYQNFYHFQWTKLLIPQWSDYLILNGSFYPPHCTSWICLQPKTHVRLIEFKVEKEPARVWITSGKKKKREFAVRPVLWLLQPTLPNPSLPQKKSSRVSLAPDSAKFSPS